ncbi:protein eyes shut homolog [Macaca nemestrina]|uniref:protein eyes shut homolog n=1 Tax=Macaca nemestrina TaxID=9545 RepID=UPI0039B9ACE3
MNNKECNNLKLTERLYQLSEGLSGALPPSLSTSPFGCLVKKLPCFPFAFHHDFKFPEAFSAMLNCTRCEIDLDECALHPCKSGATCIDQPGNYFCQCGPPFKVVDGFSCLCNPGYVGTRCEQNIDNCILNAFEHNSTYKDLHLSYQCVCLSGWEGNFCEQESNECKMNPCKNNSTCTDLYKSYR